MDVNRKTVAGRPMKKSKKDEQVGGLGRTGWLSSGRERLTVWMSAHEKKKGGKKKKHTVKRGGGPIKGGQQP